MKMSDNIGVKKQKSCVVVIGGGLVGCAAALFMTKRGYDVYIYEMRGDPRSRENGGGKSINLTMSHRGLSALEKLGLRDKVTERAIPCYGRKLHDANGNLRTMLYGENNESIWSCDRGLLHEVLLTAVVETGKIELRFNHKLIITDFQTGRLVFERTTDRTLVEIKADLILGCDGAHSCMRKQMTKESSLKYQEECIPHRYMELYMPPKQDKQNKLETTEFAMEENFLHIWARGEFMMLALPNQDKSFTVSLFMPNDIFEALRNDREKARQFINAYFTDAVPLIGEERLIQSIVQDKANPLISVKCSPYNIGGKVLLLGDAAHAMVPFYGQGVNCGFEDLVVLERILDSYGNEENLEAVFKVFSEERCEDATAMCDLSSANYIEIRKTVNSPLLTARKKLDSLLYRLFPTKWVPLYTMVAFSHMRYSDCIKHKKWQDKVVKWTLVGFGAVAAAGLCGVVCAMR